MPYLTDTHCHLNLSNFADKLEDVLDRASESGVKRILVPGIDIPSSKIAVELASKYEQIFAAVGVHPNEALNWDKNTLAELRDLSQQAKVVAIGEIGLDYYRDYSPKEMQLLILEKQIQLAEELRLPVILHSRNALSDLISLINNFHDRSNGSSLSGVFHSFEGNAAEAIQVVELGFKIGIGGPITYKNAIEKQNVVIHLALDHLLLETDAPYLAPQTHRGEMNEPAFVKYVAEKISELKKEELKQVVKYTAANAERIFSWGAPID